MSTEEITFTGFCKDEYGLTSAPKLAFFGYGRALLKIAGGDGVVSPEERAWLENYMRKCNAPDDVLASYNEFDFQSADLNEIVSSISTNVKTWTPARHLIYHGIQICSADGVYAEGERAKVFEAARLMNVPEDIVLTLEALVRMEKAVYDIRAAIFRVHTA